MVRWSNVSLNSLSGGLLVSLLLHGLIVAVLLFELPERIAEAEPEEEVVSVTIVPPPEPAPEPEPGPEPEAEEPPAEEPAEQEPAVEEPAEALPEPEPEPEQAEVAEAPSQPDVPQTGGEGEGERVPIPVFRPVFQFGEEDAGPEVALDGGASQPPAEEAPAEDAPTEAPPAEDPGAEEVTGTPPPEAPTEPDTEAAEQDPPPDETEPDQPPADPAPTLAMPDDITLPDAELDGDTPGALAEAATETELAALPEEPAKAPSALPEPKPAEPSVDVMEAPADTAPAVDNGLPGVRALSSSVNTGHAVATTAMGALPREERGSQLCTTELREQLRRAPEPYRVELLPAYRLPGGTVLNVPNAAFRAGGAWYNLSFRCTVDRDALRVTDFSFEVGAPVPRTQWRQRGFPEF